MKKRIPRYMVSLFFAYMREAADVWPGWYGGFDHWYIDQPDELNIWAFCDAHDELRHATMLEF